MFKQRIFFTIFKDKETKETIPVKKTVNQPIKKPIPLPTKNPSSATSSKNKPVFTKAPYKTDTNISNTLYIKTSNQSLKKRSASSDNLYPNNQSKTSINVLGKNPITSNVDTKTVSKPDISNIDENITALTNKVTNLTTESFITTRKKLKTKSHIVRNFHLFRNF